MSTKARAEITKYPIGSPERLARCIVLNLTYSHEVTEACVFAQAWQMRIPAETMDTAIDELLDAGLIASTIIDGRARCALDRDFGLLPALRRVKT
jgi:hypothetical protein